jgi:hypothetical protein
MPNPWEYSERVRRYLNAEECEHLFMLEVHSQTSVEYLKAYDKTDAQPDRHPSAGVLSADQAEAEAKGILLRVLKASGIKGYFVLSRKELSDDDPGRHDPVRLATWANRDPDRRVLGWLSILGPERGTGVEQAASFLAAGAASNCRDLNGRFLRGPLRPVQGGARMMTTCEYDVGKRDGGHYTFLSQGAGRLYVFETLPVFENGLYEASIADEKLSAAAIRIFAAPAER